MMWEIKCGIHTLGNPFESHDDAVKKCLELNRKLSLLYDPLRLCMLKVQGEASTETQVDQGSLPLLVVEVE